MVDAAPHGEHRIAGPRLIAIVGPFQSGKTSLLEGLLARGGGVARQGSVREGTSVGDSSPEARAHAMSVEPNIAACRLHGRPASPSSIAPARSSSSHDMRAALPVCDAAVVVCEADPRKVPALQVILRELEELKIPRFLFLNKIDLAGGGVREALEMLQPASRTPLLLRQIPLWENGVATGFVDLALERAFVYREAAPSEVVEMPDGVAPDEKQARYSMLERLADYDDALMEQLLSDIEPPRDRVFDDLAARTARGPCRAAADGLGDRRPRRHPAAEGAAPRGARRRRRRASGSASPPRGRRSPQIIRTIHTAHGGKLSLARVLRGAFADGATVIGVARRRGAHRRPAAADGRDCRRRSRAPRRATRSRSSGWRASPPAIASARARPRRRRRDALAPPPPTQSIAIHVKDRKDEVRLAAALAKLDRRGSAR